MEMQGGKPIRSTRGLRDHGWHQGGRVSRENGVLRANFVELRKNLLFKGRIFGNRFTDQISLFTGGFRVTGKT